MDNLNWLETCRFCGQRKESGIYASSGFSCYDDACWQAYQVESRERTRKEISSLIEQGLCYFTRAWIGRCKQPGSPFCDKHSNLKCSSCGAQATQECFETMGLVCGCPLCDNCEHQLAADGTNGGLTNMRHCKKGEQVYVPWYARESA